MSKALKSKSTALLSGCIAALTCGLLFAQNLDDHVRAVKTLFQEMDDNAEACLNNSQASCQNFLDTLDNRLSRYKQHCSALRSWRDQLVDENGNTDGTASIAPGTAQLLIDVEYTCGEDALVKHTSHVLAAYEKTHSDNSAGLPAVVADAHQRETLADYERLRRSLLQDSNKQQQRLSNEIQLQWQRIELENLRQQNRRPVDFGTFPPINPN